MPRFFVDRPPEGGVIRLRGEDAHHAGRVLRLRPGESVTLCDGRGTDYECTVETVSGGRGRLPRAAQRRFADRAFAAACFVHGAAQGDKMDFIVQKAVELGGERDRARPVQNCVSRPERTEKKVERWRRIAAEAAKQCGRGVLPAVRGVLPLQEAVEQAARCETALLLYENEQQTGLRAALAGGVGKTVSLLVGPGGRVYPRGGRGGAGRGADERIARPAHPAV